jgi:surfeit locus 1 family protein
VKTATLPRGRVRGLLWPGAAAFVALAILLALGFWQLERKAWKEDLIARIAERAHGEPAALPAPATFDQWSARDDEFRRVRATGTFLHEFETPVHGLAPGLRGAPQQGYYLFTPLRLPSGAAVMVNRGFVPTGLRDPALRPGSQPAGEVTVTGLLRAPEQPTLFTPEDRPQEGQWFTRDPRRLASARGFSVAPFYLEAEAGKPGDWPQGGRFRLDLPNNHLGYAVTWFGIALTLVGVFTAFAWRRLRGM